MEFSDLFLGPVPWVAKKRKRISLKSRVVCTLFHTYRNLSFFPYLSTIQSQQKKEITNKLSVLSHKGGLKTVFPLEFLNDNELNVLRERLLVPDALWQSFEEQNREMLKDISLMISKEGKSSILTNFKEHLTYSCYHPGLASKAANLQMTKNISDILTHETWSFDPQFGYLNADPKNTGSAFKVSALVHFPGAQFQRQQDLLINALNAINSHGMSIGDFTGKGGLIWLTSKSSLGYSEQEIFEEFIHTLSKFLELEEEMESEMYRTDQNKIEDSIFRSFYLLKSARILPFEEFLELCSWTKLGIYLKLLNPKMLELLDLLMVRTNNGHMHVTESQEQSLYELDIMRATMVRVTLQEY